MATISMQLARIIDKPGTYHTEDLPEAASQSYGVGAPLYLNGDGDLAILATDGVVFKGFAMEAATGVTGTLRQVQCPDPGHRILMNISNASGAGAVTNQNICDTATGYEAYVTGNRLYLDTSATANAFARVIRLSALDAEGDTGGRVEAKILDSVNQNVDG